MSIQQILFLGRHELLDSYIADSSLKNEVCVFQNAKNPLSPSGSFTYVPVEYGFFFLSKILRFFNSGITVPTYIKNFTKLATELKPDKIICLDYYLFSTWQAIQHKKKNLDANVYVYSETKRWPKNIFTRATMKLFFWRFNKNIKHVDQILVWTEQGKQWFVNNLPEANISLVPAPVNTALFVQNRQKLFLENRTLKIICNARYSSYKRHQDLFAAVSKLIANGWKIQVTCIGRSDSGRQKVEKMAQQSGVCEVVTFLDPVPQAELVKLYNSHDVLVLPSYNEAIGMVVPEAMACGIPTITSDTVGANVYVREGETGLIYTTGDVPELVQALDTLFDRSLLERMGAAAEQTIQESFTLQKCQERFRVALGLSDLA